MKGKGQGWVTAEYGMLPDRRIRDLIGKRLVVNSLDAHKKFSANRPLFASSCGFEETGERQITIDCDVLQADGGTRTASITGGMVALVDALNFLKRNGMLKEDPLIGFVAAVSVGVYKGIPVLDLDYRRIRMLILT